MPRHVTREFQSDGVGDTLTVQSFDTSGTIGKDSSVALNSNGFAVISYFDDTDFDLKVAVCNDADCSVPTINVVDGPDIVGAYTSLALNGNGFPVISYYSFTKQELKLAICNDATCNGPATFQTIDSDGDVGKHTSLALNSNGFPVISYYDETENDLKVAVCNNATCSTPTITPVDTPGEVGKYTTLALTSSDYPIISYYDETNNDLKIAVCNDIACTNPTLTRVDSPGTVGQYNSLALDSDGYPVVSYYDGSPNVDLKVAVFDPSAGISPYNIYLPIVIH
jgi:hypothetical protein